MSSVDRATRQVSMDNEYYINVGVIANRILAVGTATGATPVPVQWASTGSLAAGANLPPLWSSLSTTASLLLKDLGRTYVSSGRTFRKVQYVLPQGSNGTNSTFGVTGSGGTALPNQDYFTGYIETGFDLASGTTPAPVAKWGR
jgi:hypothetical protein